MEYFTERQHLRQPWLWLLIGGMMAVMWAIFIQQIIRGKTVGTNPMSDWGVVISWLLFGLGLPALLWYMHIETTVTADHVVIRVVPFTRRVIRPGEIVRFSTRQVRPIREYGGWGVRGWSDNRAYLMSGNTGVQLELANGDQVLIGTDRSAELETALTQLSANRS